MDTEDTENCIDTSRCPEGCLLAGFVIEVKKWNDENAETPDHHPYQQQK